MNSRTPLLAAIALALTACGGGGNGNSGPPIPNPTDCATGIETPRAFPNLSFASPVAMKQAPNDASRWFVVEQGGRIRAFENDPDADTTVDFVDLTSRVHESGEAGLLGMAFHPDFANNGRVYLNFSELVGGGVRSVTAEFTSMDGGQTLDPGSERVLLTVPKPFENHNGGNVEFGPRRLPVHRPRRRRRSRRPGRATPRTRSDCSARCCASTSMRGPAAHPTASRPARAAIRSPRTRSATSNGTGTQACPEIFALGLRNPWRWSFDRQTGDLWAGDVGPGRLGRDQRDRARRQLRLGRPRRRALLRACERLPDGRAHRPGRRIRPRRWVSRSRADMSTAAARRQSSPAATCSAISAA